ncbi:MAG: Fe-S cluster assembly ATPase SufC [Pseudomonadales bacterium]
MIVIDNLQASVNGKPILKGLTLTIEPGTVHAIMGPNGSGKSTLSHVLAGKPGYEVTGGSVRFKGRDLLAMAPEERACAGLFLAFQYPVEIPGVSNMEFLRAAAEAQAKARGETPPPAIDMMRRLREIATELGLHTDFLKRGVNEGFSGGEKKRNEILQMTFLRPALSILDETDSGLDIDALRIVGDGVTRFLRDNPTHGVLLITHYQRLLNHIVPDIVHVLTDGRIIETGDRSLALRLEEQGYVGLVDRT